MPLVDPVTTAASPAGKGTTMTTTKEAHQQQQLSTTRPVSTLASPAAQAFRHVQPALLLSLLVLRFSALVADPVTTMWQSLPAVAAIQVAYAVVCLPPVGSRDFKAPKQLRPGEKRRAAGGAGGGGGGGHESGGPNVAITTIVALFLSIFSTAAIHTIFVLFGAPLLADIPQTLLCSAYLSALGLFPLFYAHGVSEAEWMEILGARAPFDEAFGGLVGACVGAWLGAVPIPLDWDRQWQTWPITILCGVFGGYAVGKLVGGTIAFGQRFGS